MADRQDYPVGNDWKHYGQAVQVTKLPSHTFEIYDFESITVSSTAVALTYAKRQNADYALITVETASVRFRVDGEGNPTTTSGHQMDAGDKLELETHREVDRIMFIRTTVDATIRVSYGRRAVEVIKS